MLESNLAVAEVATCTLAIKHAYEGGAYSTADCRALQSAFILGKFFETVLRYPVLMDSRARTSIVRFISLVQENLPPPAFASGADQSFRLNRASGFNAQDALGQTFHEQAKLIHLGYMASFISDMQGDLLDLALRARDSAAAEAEDANYVIGMMEVTASNFGALAETADTLGNRDFNAVERFLADGCEFAAAVRSQLVN